MTKDELNDILHCEESYRIERTISTGNMDKFQEAICAFDNDLPNSRKKVMRVYLMKEKLKNID